MKFATVNEYHPNYDIPEGTLLRIIPNRKVEGETTIVRCVYARTDEEIARLTVYIFNPRDLTEIPEEVADIMMSVL